MEHDCMDYYDVDGFRFFDKEEYENALKDKETIDYINKRFDFSNILLENIKYNYHVLLLNNT